MSFCFIKFRNWGENRNKVKNPNEIFPTKFYEYVNLFSFFSFSGVINEVLALGQYTKVFWGFTNLLFRQWTGGKQWNKSSYLQFYYSTANHRMFSLKSYRLGNYMSNTKQRKPESNNSGSSTFPLLPWKMYFCMQNFSRSAWNDTYTHFLLFCESVCMYSFLHLSFLFYIESWYLHFNKPNGKISIIQT